MTFIMVDKMNDDHCLLNKLVICVVSLIARLQTAIEHCVLRRLGISCINRTHPFYVTNSINCLVLTFSIFSSVGGHNSGWCLVTSEQQLFMLDHVSLSIATQRERAFSFGVQQLFVPSLSPLWKAWCALEVCVASQCPTFRKSIDA